MPVKSTPSLAPEYADMHKIKSYSLMSLQWLGMASLPDPMYDTSRIHDSNSLKYHINFLPVEVEILSCHLLVRERTNN
jgi:hypothetical protein